MRSFRTFRRATVVTLTATLAAATLTIAPLTSEVANAIASPVPEIITTIQAYNAAHGQPDPYIRNGFIDDYAAGLIQSIIKCGVPCTAKHYHAPTAAMPANSTNYDDFVVSVSGNSNLGTRLAQAMLAQDGGGNFGASQNKYAGIASVTKGGKTWAALVVADYAFPPLDKITAPKASITGKTRVGSVLALSYGAFVPAVSTAIVQWKVKTSAGTKIVGSGNPYTLTSDDLGGTVSVTVTGTKAGYVSATTSASLPTKVTKGIFQVGVATLSGSRNVGVTLYVSEGNWFPAPAGFVYQWLRNGKVIPGAFSDNYTQTAADRGKRIQVTVGGNALGFVPASGTSKKPSVTGFPLFGKTSMPVIGGIAKFGQQLTAGADPWGPGTVKYAYQWKVGGKSIVGATTSAYLIRASDVNKTITFSITGKETGFATQTVSSAPTAAVLPLDFASVPTPIVSGVLFAGNTVKVIPGAWAPGAKFKYQWYRNFVKIKGATHSTYKLQVKDDGQMSVGVFGSRPGYATTVIYALFTSSSK
jgi:hypothetical protein